MSNSYPPYQIVVNGTALTESVMFWCDARNAPTRVTFKRDKFRVEPLQLSRVAPEIENGVAAYGAWIFIEILGEEDALGVPSWRPLSSAHGVPPDLEARITLRALYLLPLFRSEHALERANQISQSAPKSDPTPSATS